MARNFVTASAQFLRNANAVVGVAPLTLACWFRPSSFAAAQGLVGITTNASANNRFTITVLTGATVQANARDTGAGNSTTAGTLTLSTWGHCGAVFASTTSRTAYLNGTAATADTTSISPSGMNETLVGSGANSAQRAAGDIAEVGIWNVALSATDMAALAKGVSPLLIRPDKLVFYSPLMGLASPEPEFRSRLDLTLSGSPVAAVHPRMYYPTSGLLLGVPTASNTTTPKNFTGTLTCSGVLTKAVSVSKTGTLTETGVLTKAVALGKTGALTPSGVLTKACSKALTGALTLGGVLTKAASHAMTGTMTLTGALTRACAKAFTGTLTTTGSLTKAVAKAFSGTLTLSGAFSALRVTLLNLTGTLTATGALTKQCGKVLAGALTPDGTLTKACSKALTGSLAFTGVLGRAVSKAFAGALSLLGSLTNIFTGGTAPVDSRIGGTIRISASIGGTVKLHPDD